MSEQLPDVNSCTSIKHKPRVRIDVWQLCVYKCDLTMLPTRLSLEPVLRKQSVRSLLSKMKAIFSCIFLQLLLVIINKYQTFI